LRPGQTASPSWHNAAESLISRGGETWQVILLVWTAVGIITGGAVLQAGADLVSTSAISDGSVMSRSSMTANDAIITGTILGTGPSGIIRETGTGTSPYSSLAARSEGPLLFGGYASFQNPGPEDRPLACVFSNHTGPESGMTTGASGILRKANLSQLITLHPGEHGISVDGEGMVDLYHRLDSNGTVSGRTLASGNLSVSEYIRTGGNFP